MLRTLASHPFDPLEGINLYFYELSGLCIAITALIMIAVALCRFTKRRLWKSEVS